MVVLPVRNFAAVFTNTILPDFLLCNYLSIMYENQSYCDIFVIHKEVVSLQTCDLKYEIEIIAYMFIMMVQVITILGCSVCIIFNTVVTCIAIISGIICHPILVLSV